MADVLIVEDEAEIRSLLAELVNDEGHPATVACDGGEALAFGTTGSGHNS